MAPRTSEARSHRAAARSLGTHKRIVIIARKVAARRVSIVYPGGEVQLAAPPHFAAADLGGHSSRWSYDGIMMRADRISPIPADAGEPPLRGNEEEFA